MAIYQSQGCDIISKDTNATVCGLCCLACDFQGKLCIKPCSAARGKMRWGQCQIYLCCEDKGYEHCGLCPDFPGCEPMVEIEGIEKRLNIPIDNKLRMKNLKRRMELGTKNWIDEMVEEYKNRDRQKI
ncbi:MAG: DUF3795 domain-containing protein [Halobacteriota archaeon]|nr:DUF3795 domain-containing protein [Halobacteriota archaeon]